jgi:hypothetical protein
MPSEQEFQLRSTVAVLRIVFQLRIGGDERILSNEKLEQSYSYTVIPCYTNISFHLFILLVGEEISLGIKWMIF